MILAIFVCTTLYKSTSVVGVSNEAKSEYLARLLYFCKLPLNFHQPITGNTAIKLHDAKSAAVVVIISV